MILVTLGTQDKNFTRLLDEIQRLINKHIIKDRVVVQAGYTKYQSPNMEIFDLIDRDNFKKLIAECSLLITHGGVGSILSGIMNNKKVIAIPRLEKYNEHINDHQIQIVNKFNNDKYIIGINDVSELEKAINKSKTFTPKKFISNTHNMVNLIEKFIDKD